MPGETRRRRAWAAGTPAATLDRERRLTRQVHDEFWLDEVAYDLLPVEGDRLSDPVIAGLRPVAASAACWRGYACEYEVHEAVLRLRALTISHESEPRPAPGSMQRLSEMLTLRRLRGGEDDGRRPPPEFNGVQATLLADDPCGCWRFSEAKLPIVSSSRLVVATDFSQRWSSLERAPMCQYERVRVLAFEAGRMVSARDVSEHVAALRERVQAQPTARRWQLQSRIDEALETRDCA